MFKIYIILIAILLTSCATTRTVTIKDILGRGSWGWITKDRNDCVDNPHTIAFSGDRSEAYFRWFKPLKDSVSKNNQVATYQISQWNDNSIVMTIVGETRIDAKGHPVVWELFLVSENEYNWNRRDWDRNDRTISVYRCK